MANLKVQLIQKKVNILPPVIRQLLVLLTSIETYYRISGGSLKTLILILLTMSLNAFSQEESVIPMAPYFSGGTFGFKGPDVQGSPDAMVLTTGNYSEIQPFVTHQHDGVIEGDFSLLIDQEGNISRTANSIHAESLLNYCTHNPYYEIFPLVESERIHTEAKIECVGGRAITSSDMKTLAMVRIWDTKEEIVATGKENEVMTTQDGKYTVTFNIPNKYIRNGKTVVERTALKIIDNLKNETKYVGHASVEAICK